VGNLYSEEKVSNFSLEGRFISFVGEMTQKTKRLQVATAEGERYIKLSKELRYSLTQVLQPGDWIQISGEQKRKHKTGELKLKAFQVKLTTAIKQQEISQPVAVTPSTKACIMVCQKSACYKRGAALVGQALTASLRDCGLVDQVTVKGTGCMKECKRGPCVVFMPDKSRYTGVAPKEIPHLIEKHFADNLLKPKDSKIERKNSGRVESELVNGTKNSSISW